MRTVLSFVDTVLESFEIKSEPEKDISLVWWIASVIPALGGLRQEDCHEFKVNLNYILRSRTT